MQTSITAEHLKSYHGQRADEILRNCVHCGFCTATCPTYQLLGDELDGPRGRIYQIKNLLEGQTADREILTHLDRCLSCRSCETTCPSGVDYAELLDIGRQHLETLNIRSFNDKLKRKILGFILPHKARHTHLFKLASLLRQYLPVVLKSKTPVIRPAKNYQQMPAASLRTVLLLEGCVQSTLSPNTNAAATLVLQSMGYRVIREPVSSCCGAVNQHLNQLPAAEQWVVKNLRKWKKLDNSYRFDAIVSTATGCGVMLKDYPKILKNMPQNSTLFETQINKIKDISELLDTDALLKNIANYTANQKMISLWGI